MSEKIVRTPSRVTGGITAEEKVKLDAHAAKWIANAMSTAPVAPERLVPAVHALYEAAGLKQPRVVIVSSPIVMAFAGGFAAAIWWARKNSAEARREHLSWEATRAATYAATRAATRAATDAATDAATGAATRAATRAATDAATRAATDAATDAATGAATRAATYAATGAATRAATYAATDAATGAATRAATDATRFASLARQIGAEFGVDPIFMLRCAQNWYRMYQGGNMWSYYDCYLSAFRDVLGLVIPEHERYRAWEACAIEGGFRIVHEEFCIVSDRPAQLHKDEQNRPHCETGPSHLWRDGFALYYWHGVQVPEEWITQKNITAAEALRWPNMEQRRAACEIIGWAKVLEELDARVIDTDEDPEIGQLLEAQIPDSGPERFLKVRCGTGRQFVLSVPRDCKTALAANAWTYGLDAMSFKPEVRT